MRVIFDMNKLYNQYLNDEIEQEDWEEKTEEMRDYIVNRLGSSQNIFWKSPYKPYWAEYDPHYEISDLWEIYDFMVDKGTVDLIELDNGHLGIKDEHGRVAELIGADLSDEELSKYAHWDDNIEEFVPVNEQLKEDIDMKITGNEDFEVKDYDLEYTGGGISVAYGVYDNGLGFSLGSDLLFVYDEDSRNEFMTDDEVKWEEEHTVFDEHSMGVSNSAELFKSTLKQVFENELKKSKESPERILDYYDLFRENEELLLGDRIDVDESLTESAEDRVVIYKEFGKYRATPESNYNNRIQDVRKVQKLDAFESPDQIINYYIKYGWAKSPDEFIVKDDENESLKEKVLKESSLQLGEVELEDGGLIWGWEKPDDYWVTKFYWTDRKNSVARDEFTRYYPSKEAAERAFKRYKKKYQDEGIVIESLLKEDKKIWGSDSTIDYYYDADIEELKSELEDRGVDPEEYAEWSEEEIRDYFVQDDYNNEIDYEDFKYNILPNIDSKCYADILVLFGDAANWRGTRGATKVLHKAEDLMDYVYPNFDATTEIFEDETGTYYTQSTHDTPTGGTKMYLYSLKSEEDLDKLTEYFTTPDGWFDPEYDYAVEFLEDHTDYNDIRELINKGILTPIKDIGM